VALVIPAMARDLETSELQVQWVSLLPSTLALHI